MANGPEAREPSEAMAPASVARFAAALKATPAVTGADIACALRHAGCDVRLAAPDHVSVFRDGAEVARLPLGMTVRAATLRALLRSLGVSAEEFAQYLLDETDRQHP